MYFTSCFPKKSVVHEKMILYIIHDSALNEGPNIKIKMMQLTRLEKNYVELEKVISI